MVHINLHSPLTDITNNLTLKISNLKHQTRQEIMVQATDSNQRLQSLIVKAFNQIQYHTPSDKSLRGSPSTKSDVVTALISSKGKDFCADAKRCPAEVKSVGDKVVVEEDGFNGQKVGDQKTGKAKQWHTDGSYFDGFMLGDELVRGRYYFPNGDFYQGRFNDGQLQSGMYLQGGGLKAELKEATFEGGEPTGKVEIMFTIEETKLSLQCNYVKGKPDGLIKIKENDKQGPEIDSPWKEGVLDQ